MGNSGIIYMVTNKITKQSYIGLTTKTLKERKSQHINSAMVQKSPLFFHGAIRKYGKKNFT